MFKIYAVLDIATEPQRAICISAEALAGVLL